MVPEAEYVPCVCGAAVEITMSVEAELKLYRAVGEKVSQLKPHFRHQTKDSH